LWAVPKRIRKRAISLLVFTNLQVLFPKQRSYCENERAN